MKPGYESSVFFLSIVREKEPEAKALADRYFMETAVRLHRAGEGAPYTGLKPAGTDFGPAIPAAEKALKIGKSNDLTALMAEQVAHGIEDRYRDAMAYSAATMEPTTAADVAKARERVSAELAFIGYVEASISRRRVACMSKLRPLRITTKARNDVSDRPVLRYGSYGGLCSALQAGEMFGAANIIGRFVNARVWRRGHRPARRGRSL